MSITRNGVKTIVDQIFELVPRPRSNAGGPPELLTPDKKRAREVGLSLEAMSSRATTDEQLAAQAGPLITEANQLISRMKGLKAAADKSHAPLPAAPSVNAKPARPAVSVDDMQKIMDDYNALADQVAGTRNATMIKKNLRPLAEAAINAKPNERDGLYRKLSDEVIATRTVLGLGGDRPQHRIADEFMARRAQDIAALHSKSAGTSAQLKKFFTPPPNLGSKPAPAPAVVKPPSVSSADRQTVKKNESVKVDPVLNSDLVKLSQEVNFLVAKVSSYGKNASAQQQDLSKKCVQWQAKIDQLINQAKTGKDIDSIKPEMNKLAQAMATELKSQKKGKSSDDYSRFISQRLATVNAMQKSMQPPKEKSKNIVESVVSAVRKRF